MLFHSITKALGHAALAAMTVAGGMLALGIAHRAAAEILAGTPVPTTLVGHPVRKEEGEKGGWRSPPRAGYPVRDEPGDAGSGLLLASADEE